MELLSCVRYIKHAESINFVILGIADSSSFAQWRHSGEIDNVQFVVTYNGNGKVFNK